MRQIRHFTLNKQVRIRQEDEHVWDGDKIIITFPAGPVEYGVSPAFCGQRAKTTGNWIAYSLDWEQVDCEKCFAKVERAK